MPTIVKVKLVITIPSTAVQFYLAGYGGTFNGGAKCSPSFEIDIDKAGAAALRVAPLEWAITHSYPDADAGTVSGKPDWYRNLKAGAVEIESKRLERTEANLSVISTSMHEATHAALIKVEGKNPLLMLAPAIDAELTIGVRKRGALTEFRVLGIHDGFPNYSIEINGKQVYLWDCVNADKSPADLRPPAEIDIDIDWRAI